MTDIFKFKRDDFYRKEGVKTYMNQVVWYGSILDIPKEERSKSIIICFSEPSYNGRQALYHLFGEKLGLKPYQVFVDAMEKTQKNGDAIVFGEEEVMWFPGAKAEAAAFQESMNAIKPRLVIPDEPNTKAQLATIAESLKALTAAVAALAAKA